MGEREVYCQSCGMPMAEAKEEDWGTNADGSRSTEYCSFCYKDGKFTEPNITLQEMIEKSAKGWSDYDPDVSYEKALAVCQEMLPKLSRWKK